MEPIDSIKAANTLGECVLWDDRTASLWWTDIEEKSLWRYEWVSRSLRRFATPERLCSFGFVRQSDKLIAAFETGFALFNPRDGATLWLDRPEMHRPGMRLNDGRVDRQGRFWAGSMAEHEAHAGKAALYCVDAAGTVGLHESGITISNGIAWSPDGTLFYFADTPRRTIWRYAFDRATGAISDRHVFAETEAGAFPDGASTDAQGRLWIALWGAGEVACYAPDGSLEQVLAVPAKQPACVTFGGPALDLLFVTTARTGLGECGPGDGDVFVYRPGTRGLPEERFNFARP